MEPLRLLLLGPPRLERGDRILQVDTRKATALLAYLALSGERPSRDWLAAFLWPDSDERRAKAALRRTLSALKRAVGGEALFASREVIALQDDAVWCDVFAFRQAVAAGSLTAAVDLYRDDFMAGFSLRDSIPFDDWQLQQQESLRREFSRALARLAQTGAGETAVAYARRWCRVDPLREEAHRTLMRLLAENGRANDALMQYRDCVRILDEELGVPPLPETTALYQAIQNDRVMLVEEAPETRPAPGPSFTPALVGRDVALQKMEQLYQQAGPDGRLLIIEGEPGIGKTRLAETLVASAAAAGAATLVARCYEGETNLAYAPLLQALQAGLTPAALARLEALPEHHLTEAARLLPALTAGRRLPPPAGLSGPGAQVRFYEGVIQLLLTLLDGPVPGILWLDDVHWLDAGSLEILLYLLHRWQQRPLFTIFCWRAEELPVNSPLTALAAKLRRENACRVVRLDRFTETDIAALLTSSGNAFTADLPRQLYRETEGLPMFVVAYLDALSAHDGRLRLPDDFAVPASVRDLLRQRLVQVSETERQILQTAAAVGHSFDLPLVQTVSGRSDEETVAALESLTARGLLVEQNQNDQAAYDFSHDKLRALVYEETGLARRRLLHRRLADTLQADRTATAAVSAQIAVHYQQAGLEREAAAYFVQAADQARALFAHQDALHFYEAALALGAEEPWRRHAACGELQIRLGNYPAALTSLEKAAALAPAAELGRLEHQLAQVYQRQGQWGLAAQTLAQARVHLDANGPDAQLAHLILDQGLVAHRQKQPQAALTLARQAHTLALEAENSGMLALAENILGILARQRGEMETAVTHHQKSRALADAGALLDIQIAARNNLALTLGGMGQTDAAVAALRAAIQLCRRYGDRHYEAALRSNLADMYHQAGDDTAAREQIRQSVTIYAEIGQAHDSWQAEIWQLMEW
jgi:DNA-binding SARP family transcriptional activator/predicted ATPase